MTVNFPKDLHSTVSKKLKFTGELNDTAEIITDNQSLMGRFFTPIHKCYSLREIDMGIDQSPEFLAYLGLSKSPAKSTMSDVNAKPDYRVFEDLCYSICSHYKVQLNQRPEYKIIDEIKDKNIKIVMLQL